MRREGLIETSHACMLGEFEVVERLSVFAPRQGINEIPKSEVPFGLILAVTRPSYLKASYLLWRAGGYPHIYMHDQVSGHAPAIFELIKNIYNVEFIFIIIIYWMLKNFPSNRNRANQTTEVTFILIFFAAGRFAMKLPLDMHVQEFVIKCLNMKNWEFYTKL